LLPFQAQHNKERIHRRFCAIPLVWLSKKFVAMAATFKNPPQAFLSSYAPRIRTYGNSLLTPVIPQVIQVPTVRTTKRGTTAINYAEDGFDEEDFEDSEGPRRPTGLRSLRRDDQVGDKGAGPAAVLGKELAYPVVTQGIWREWMGKPKKQMYVKRINRDHAYYEQCLHSNTCFAELRNNIKFNLPCRLH